MYAPRDENFVPSMLAASNVDGTTPVVLYADPVTHRLLVDLPGGGSGTVTSVSVVTANGVSGSVATATTTPAITLTLGDITPSSVVSTGVVRPSANDGAALGSATVSWADLFLATGSLINIANGNWVATHSSGILTVSTGDLRVTTAGTNTASVVTVGGTQTLTGKTLTSPTFSAPVLGTPASGTLTNTTGFPAANLAGLGTGVATFLATPSSANLASAVTGETGSGALVFGTSPDFTTSVTLGGVAIPTISSTDTLTNKRVTPRVGTVADAATITPTGDSSDMYTVTALAQAATIAAPSGTPTNGQKLIIRLLDNGTARALTWDSVYVAIGVTLPTTTVLSKYTYVGCIYSTADSKWHVVAVTTQA